MTMDTALYAYLSNAATLQSLLRGHIAPAVEASQVPLPRLTYVLVAYDSVHHLRGPEPIARSTYQLDVWATRNREAEAISEAVRIVLDGYRGLQEGIAIRHTRLADMRAMIEEAEDGSQQPYHRRMLEYDIWHTRQVGTFSY